VILNFSRLKQTPNVQRSTSNAQSGKSILQFDVQRSVFGRMSSVIRGFSLAEADFLISDL